MQTADLLTVSPPFAAAALSQSKPSTNRQNALLKRNLSFSILLGVSQAAISNRHISSLLKAFWCGAVKNELIWLRLRQKTQEYLLYSEYF